MTHNLYYKDKKYHCEICNLTFNSKIEAIDHHEIKHECSDYIKWDDLDGWILWIDEIGLAIVGIEYCPFCGKSLPPAKEVYGNLCCAT